MRPNSQFPVDLITFTKQIRNEKLQFLCSAWFHGLQQSQTFTHHLRKVILLRLGNLGISLHFAGILSILACSGSVFR